MKQFALLLALACALVPSPAQAQFATRVTGVRLLPQGSAPSNCETGRLCLWSRSSDSHLLYFNGSTTADLVGFSAALSAAKGSIAVYDGTGWSLLGVGTNNYVLTADSTQATGLKWAAAGGGSTNGLLGAYQGASGTMQNIIGLTSTLGPALVRDNATPLGGTLFGVQDSGGSSKFFDVTASGASVQGTLTVKTIDTGSTGVTLTMKSQLAEGVTPAITFSSGATWVTSSNKLFSWQNNGSEIAALSVGGELYANRFTSSIGGDGISGANILIGGTTNWSFTGTALSPSTDNLKNIGDSSHRIGLAYIVQRSSGASSSTNSSSLADSSTAVAHIFDTGVSYATAGAKLISWRNNTTEKANVAYNGEITGTHHIASKTTVPTIACAAGPTGCSVTITGSDEGGKITFNASTTTGNADIFTVTFGTAFPTSTNVSVTLAPADATTAAQTFQGSRSLYVSAASNASFTVANTTAVGSGIAWTLYYVAKGSK